jgi:hypothetical protein
MIRTARAFNKMSEREGVFDPSDKVKVEHHKYGIWDYYEEKNPELEKVPGKSKIEELMIIHNDFPIFLTMLKDIGSDSKCRMLLILFAVVELVSGLLPSLRLWFSGQLLSIVSILSSFLIVLFC